VSHIFPAAFEKKRSAPSDPFICATELRLAGLESAAVALLFLTSGYVNSLLLKMAIFHGKIHLLMVYIEDFPLKNGQFQ
jgi:hypothetical protein